MVILSVVQLGDSSLSFLPYAENIVAHNGRDHDCQTPKDEYSCFVESWRPFIEWIKCKYCSKTMHSVESLLLTQPWDRQSPPRVESEETGRAG